MTTYRTKGVLTGTIEPENVAAAAQYLLTNHDGTPTNMEQYLDPPLKGVVLYLTWNLLANGHDYTITAVTSRDLTDDELKALSSECSGQNSDGLGEGFEQQHFAETHDDDEQDCDECSGQGSIVSDEGLAETCGECDGDGYFESDNYGMISFDWKTNELPWEKIS